MKHGRARLGVTARYGFIHGEPALRRSPDGASPTPEGKRFKRPACVVPEQDSIDETLELSVIYKADELLRPLK